MAELAARIEKDFSEVPEVDTEGLEGALMAVGSSSVTALLRIEVYDSVLVIFFGLHGDRGWQ